MMVLLFCAVALMSIASGGASAAEGVTQTEMEAVCREVATPHKIGMVLTPENGELIDCPVVFRQGATWLMMYVRFDGKGYETCLAESTDLKKWKKRGRIFWRGEKGAWDSAQADGVPALFDLRWDGPNTFGMFDGKYWMSYIGGSADGYETDPLSTGIAWTDDIATTNGWRRYGRNPVLTPSDPDVRDFERKTIYRHCIIEDPLRRLGARFVSYYNAKQEGPWIERIGMAVSDDLLKWRRYGDRPVIDDVPPGKTGISGDPMIRKIGDLWVMFYFGYNWRPGLKGGFDTFACSRDLVHWRTWNGEPLVKPSEPYDAEHAHKPWVLRHEGVVYHFYCAVGDRGRGIALAVSKEEP